MSTIVLTNVKRIAKYIGLFLLTIVGLYLGTLLIMLIYNLGTYIGTYLRCIYSAL